MKKIIQTRDLNAVTKSKINDNFTELYDGTVPFNKLIVAKIETTCT